MFEKNILTFNPGWDSNTRQLNTFTDVREIQRQLKAEGIEFSADDSPVVLCDCEVASWIFDL
jgi:lactoylglutathione lyase